MDSQTQTSEPMLKDKTVENARTGYNTAINLWIYEGTLIWNKFTAMVYANTILLITIGVIITGNRWRELCLILFVLCFLGIILCICWYIMNKRSFKFYKYWIMSARELEEQYLEPIKIISRVGDYADNKEVKISLDTGDMHLIIKGMAKRKVENVVNVIICIFIFVYIVIMFHYLIFL